MTTKNTDKLKKITGQTDFPFVSAGVVASENANGHVVNEDALVALIEAAEAGEAAQATIAGLQAQLTAAQSAQQSAEAALVSANATIATNTTSINTLEARVAELEEDGSIPPTSRAGDQGGKVKMSFHKSPENPMNKIADSLLGAPKPVAEK